MSAIQASGSSLAASDAGAAVQMPPPASQLSRALSDIVLGARSVQLWGPLLGQAPPPLVWLAVAGVTLGGWAATLRMGCQFRRRIASWV